MYSIYSVYACVVRSTNFVFGYIFDHVPTTHGLLPCNWWIMSINCVFVLEKDEVGVLEESSMENIAYSMGNIVQNIFSFP